MVIENALLANNETGVKAFRTVGELFICVLDEVAFRLYVVLAGLAVLFQLSLTIIFPFIMERNIPQVNEMGMFFYEFEVGREMVFFALVMRSGSAGFLFFVAGRRVA
jgi:hypothetical protein